MKKALKILAAAVSMSLAVLTPASAAPEEETVSNAYLHLDGAMDEWAAAPALRLPSSYHGGHLDSWNNSVIYDDALVIIAYANRKDNADSLERAKNMGDAFLQMQAKDPIGDGRVRNSYGPENLFDADGVPNILSTGTAAGNQAWAGMALAHLAHVTKDAKYRDGALRVGEWLLRETSDSRGTGGFTAGYGANGEKMAWNSTEHNIDMVGLFGMLHQLTNDDKWSKACEQAREFVKSMWDEKEGRFHIGTESDGVTINRDEYIPEDVQSWGYLALRSEPYARALDWAVANVETTDNTNPDQPIVGVRFALRTNPEELSRNDDTVWLEGTAHMALALRASGTEAHKQKASAYLDSIHKEQLNGPNADGKGIQANSKEGYSGGDDVNYTSLHTGATAWYLMAKQDINPFHLAAQ